MKSGSASAAATAFSFTSRCRREIELEENLRRKDLTPFEQARELVRKAPVVAEAISTVSVEKAPQGRKSDYSAPKKDVAQALGVSTTALVEAEQHVALAEEFPFMQSPEWSQSAVLQREEGERGRLWSWVAARGARPTLTSTVACYCIRSAG